MDLSWIKRLNWKTIFYVLVAAMLLVCVLSVRSCLVRGKQALVLAGQNQVLKTELADQMATHAKERVALTSEILRLDGQNKELRATVEQKNATINANRTTIGALAEARKALTDKDEIIANLDKQVLYWTSQFNLSQSVITDKDQIIFNLTTQLEDKTRINLTLSEDLKKSLALNKNYERQIKLLGPRGWDLGKTASVALNALEAVVIAYLVVK